MSKKHFIALADMLRALKPNRREGVVIGMIEDNFHRGCLNQWEYDMRALADFCAAQNSNFNRERWMDYIAGKCGPGGGAVKGR